jgi:hypothetical protein
VKRLGGILSPRFASLHPLFKLRYIKESCLPVLQYAAAAGSLSTTCQRVADSLMLATFRSVLQLGPKEGKVEQFAVDRYAFGLGIDSVEEMVVIQQVLSLARFLMSPDPTKRSFLWNRLSQYQQQARIAEDGEQPVLDEAHKGLAVAPVFGGMLARAKKAESWQTKSQWDIVQKEGGDKARNKVRTGETFGAKVLQSLKEYGVGVSKEGHLEALRWGAGSEAPERKLLTTYEEVEFQLVMRTIRTIYIMQRYEVIVSIVNDLSCREPLLETSQSEKQLMQSTYTRIMHGWWSGLQTKCLKQTCIACN